MGIYFILFIILFHNLKLIGFCYNGKYFWTFVILYPIITFYPNYIKYFSLIFFLVPLYTIRRKRFKPVIPFIFLLALFLSINASLPITHHDYHGYYLQTIAWLKEYGTVIGLGNLEGRFGFNSFGLILASLFSFDLNTLGMNFSAVLFPLNAVFLLVLIDRIINYLRVDSELVIKYFFVLIGLFSIVFYGKWIGTPSNDITSGLIISFIMLGYKKWLGSKDLNIELILIVLIFLSMVVKLSSGLTILFLIPLFVLNNDKSKFILKTVIVGSLILLPFFVKNILLTGYLVFPFHQLDIFNFDWKMPIEKVIEVKNGIFIWARIPGEKLDFLLSNGIKGWFKDWYLRQDFLTRILLITNLIFPFVVFLTRHRKDIFISTVSIIIVVNLIFWFIQAPDPRFTFGYLFAGSSLFFSVLFNFLYENLKSPNFLFKPIFLLKSGFVLIFCFYCYYQYPKLIQTNFLRDVVLFPSNIESPQVKIIHAENFFYYVPEGGNCENFKLPCANQEVKGIKLRGTSIREGFYIE